MSQLQAICSGFIVLLGIYGVLPSPLGAQTFVYPDRGQSQERQQQDEFACHQWAVQQTGFDPSAPQAVPTPPPPSYGTPSGGLFRGAAGGAALGAVGGAIAGHAGEGAAIGAAVGGLFGGMRRRAAMEQEMQAQQGATAHQAAVSHQNHSAYNRAYSACLTGRGYTVR